jgi:hypothetical protein
MNREDRDYVFLSRAWIRKVYLNKLKSYWNSMFVLTDKWIVMWEKRRFMPG